MKNLKLGSKKSVTTIGISGALLSGVVTYLFSFFTDAYPAIEKKVIILETENSQIKENQKEIKKELRQIHEGQKKIYYYLISKDKS